MVFSSTVFLFIFLPIVLIAYFNPFFKSRRIKNFILMFSSIGFYAWGEPFFVFVMLTSITINWLLAKSMLRPNNTARAKKAWLAFSCVYNVLIIVVFKYLTFILESLNLLLKRDAFSLSIALPIGISFFTFQLISYMVDVYRKKSEVQNSLINLALYITLFPQLIAGPIVRYETIEMEITSRTENKDDFTNGILRFIVGLGKKVLIADTVGYIADIAFDNPSSTATAWLGVVAYALQIYYDFSGYSDMALGLGLVFGFHFEENFNYPYISRSITEFWRRWHISLSTWFRDYVYIPLGGNQISPGRTIINLFVVWMLTGMWHGANWTFLAWGLYYFILLMIERKSGLAGNRSPFGLIYTMLFILIGWVLFRSESLTAAVDYISVMFILGADSIVDSTFMHLFKMSAIILALGCLFATPIAKTLQARFSAYGGVIDAIAAIGIVAIFVLALIQCIGGSYSPFIYFNF